MFCICSLSKRNITVNLKYNYTETLNEVSFEQAASWGMQTVCLYCCMFLMCKINVSVILNELPNLYSYINVWHYWRDTVCCFSKLITIVFWPDKYYSCLVYVNNCHKCNVCNIVLI